MESISITFSPQRRESLREAARSALGLGPSDFAILLVGNDWNGKGLPSLLKAVRKTGEPRLCVLVAGSDDPAAFAAEIAEARRAVRVDFLPIRPDVEFYYA